MYVVQCIFFKYCPSCELSWKQDKEHATEALIHIWQTKHGEISLPENSVVCL